MTALNLKITSLVFCCAAFFAAHAQTNGTDTGFIYKANIALNELAAKQPTEKVYLHLDKPYYAAGDDIWFKAYLVSGDFHQPLGVSGVLTVELTNDAGDPVKTLQLAIKQGSASGDFHLPYTFAAGKYHIRAYTNYMRNAGSDSFFDQLLHIAGVTKQDKSTGNVKPSGKTNLAGQSSATLASNADVQFFPESGSLVNGINSRIAFKAVGENGMGITVNAIVVDNAGAEVTRFTSQHLGMGSFNLNPVPGKSYFAKLTFNDSSHKAVNIPTALNFGYGLRIANNNESKDVVYQVSYINAAAKNVADSTLNLIVQSAGSISYAAKIRLKRTSTIGRIPKDKLPTGVSQFTLFLQSGEPLCERLIFINNHDQLNIAIADSNKINNIHQSTSIKLNIKDAENKPVNGSFSAAVIDDDLVPDNDLTDGENILSYLLLTSDIKGKIEKPGYYFNKNNDTTAANLDLLMLTQGYRYFEWKQILNNHIPPLTYQPENGIKVTGHLLTRGGKPAAKGSVTYFTSKVTYC